MTKRTRVQERKLSPLVMGGIAALIIGITFALVLIISPSTPEITAETITADAERATQHELLTVREAGEMLLNLLSGAEFHLEECPTVGIFGNVGTMQPTSNSIAVGVVPSTGTDQLGNIVLVEDIGFTGLYWSQIPESDRWSYIWHEMEHVRQDCVLLETTYRETNLSGEALWFEFDHRWQETAAEKEAYPLAVQAYWQTHDYPVTVFPALVDLMNLLPNAWKTDLPPDANDVPIGIELQPEWPDWVELVERVYVVR